MSDINELPLNSARTHTGFAVLLASISALFPLSIDMYLSAMPAIAQELGAGIDRVEATLGLFLLGAALANIVAGFFSDRAGRRVTAIIGLVTFALGSVGLANSDTLWSFQLFRLLQAVGAGFSTVVVAASVRDRFSGNEAARVFALIVLIMLGAPLAAPILGSMILRWFDWQSIFYCLALYAAVVLMFVLRFLPANNPADGRLGGSLLRAALADYAKVLGNTPALGYLFMQTASTAAMFCFITEASFVYMTLYGADETRFAQFFALNIITMVIFNRVTAFKLKTTRARNILLFGVGLQLLLNLGLITQAFIYGGVPPFWLLLPMVMLSVGSQGFISANASSCYMDYFAQNSGSAAAVSSTSISLISALVGFSVAALHDGQSVFPMVSMMLACTLVGTSLLFLLNGDLRRAVAARFSL